MDDTAGIPVLTYHSIDGSGSIISTSRDTFQRQMSFLKKQGYQAITLGDLAARPRSAASFSEKIVVLTFDDGFRNFLTQAFPILDAHGFKATVFLVTDLCGGYNDWAGNPKGLPRSKLLSWPEIRELDRAGVEFGSHTRTHPDLTRLSTKDIFSEMVDSKLTLSSAIGHDVRTFAYPYGRANREARRIARDHFEASCSTDLGTVGVQSDRTSLRRIDAFYIRTPRVLEKLPTAGFDNYLRIRHAMRKVRSAITGS